MTDWTILFGHPLDAPPSTHKVKIHSKTDHMGVSEEKLLSIAEQEQEILTWLRMSPGMLSSELREHMALPKRTMATRLTKLIGEGKVYYRRKRRLGLQGTTCHWYVTAKEREVAP